MALLFVENQNLVEPHELTAPLSITALTAAPPAPPAITPGFTPIGIGKPLSVEIVTMYVGNHMSTFLDNDKNVLLVSGVKAIQTFNAVARAMNYTKQNVKNFEYPAFSGFQDGTSIVYYTQALDTETILITFEFI